MAGQGRRGFPNRFVPTRKVSLRTSLTGFSAIRVIRRRGRKKADLKGKQSGGNEFIADFIEQTTGVKRNRKQVSSHIQVLKGFLSENKACKSDTSQSQPTHANCSTLGMSLVADIAPEKTGRTARRSTASEEAAGKYDDSDYDDESEYQPVQASYRPYPNCPPAPTEILASNVYPGPTVRRVSEFTMTLQDHYERNLHIYTSIQSETASAPKALEDVKDWREKYPPLAAYSDQGQINCPIFLFDTHLSLMDDYYDKSRLAIKLSVDFSQGARFTEWRSYSRFYEQNGCLVDFTKLYPESESWDRLHSEQIEGTADSSLGQIALKPAWWAQVFSNIIGKKKIVEVSRNPGLVRQEEEVASQYLRNISVMQEIWAVPLVYESQPKPQPQQQRMAILLWRFSTTPTGKAATTSWRRLHPPVSPCQIQEPPPSPQQPPMTLDTALQSVPTYTEHYISQPSVFSGDPSGNLLTGPLSESSSPSPTPSPNSRSFPSSTSTSFPSSASNPANSAYSMYPAHESFFHSQDSIYPPLSPFHSQHSGYTQYEHHGMVDASQESFGSHEFAVDSQEAYDSQEVVYHSQDSFYQQVPDPLYTYPSQQLDTPPGTASTSQDFTGGQIQLSYAQTENSQSSYDAPLVAPQANMMPKHQLIQHPEHFDQHDYLDQELAELGANNDELDEQSHTEPLLQSYELNGLTMDYNNWEETLRLNPDLERHLSINEVDEVGHIGQQYISPVGHEALERIQGGVVGEVQDEEDGAPDRELEYR